MAIIVLGNYQYRGVLRICINGREGQTVLAVGAVGIVWTIFYFCYCCPLGGKVPFERFLGRLKVNVNLPKNVSNGTFSPQGQPGQFQFITILSLDLQV